MKVRINASDEEALENFNEATGRDCKVGDVVELNLAEAIYFTAAHQSFIDLMGDEE